MYTYLQTSEDGFVVAVGSLPDKSSDPNLILVPEFTEDMLRRRYISADKYVYVKFYFVVSHENKVVSIKYSDEGSPPPVLNNGEISIEYDNHDDSHRSARVGSSYINGKFLHVNPRDEMENRIAKKIIDTMEARLIFANTEGS